MANPDEAGMIGGEVLRRFSVTFDYENRVMYLSPNEQFQDACEYDMSGLFLASASDHQEEAVVLEVLKDSPAAEAGLRQEDRILAVDGTPVRNMTLDHLRQLLKRHGASVEFLVKRRGNTLSVTLKLRRLI